MTIFISYSRVDADVAAELARCLRELDVRVWLDQVDISAGVRWDTAIERALHDCKALLVLLSPASVTSQNVLDEVGFALDEKKTVLPILLSACSIPLRIRRLQRIPFSGDFVSLAAAVAASTPASLKMGVPSVQASPAESDRDRPSAQNTELPKPALRPHNNANVQSKSHSRATKASRQPTVNGLARRKNQTFLELRAVDVALSEIPSSMPGERKRLEIQRDRLAELLAKTELELNTLLGHAVRRTSSDA